VTRYRLPPGFLRGTAEVPFRWRHSVSIEAELSPDEWACIQTFQWRASEFLLNIDDLSLPNEFIGSTELHHRDASGKHIGKFSSNIWPGRFRAKSLFMDFRPLLLQKGKSSIGNFYRTKNIVAKSTSNAALKAFTNQVAASFLGGSVNLSVDPALPEHRRAVTLNSLLDLWINAYYFHNGNAEQSRKREEMLAIFEVSGMEQVLFFELVLAAHQVRCLYAVVQNSSPQSLYFSCPDERMVRQSGRSRSVA